MERTFADISYTVEGVSSLNCVLDSLVRIRWTLKYKYTPRQIHSETNTLRDKYTLECIRLCVHLIRASEASTQQKKSKESPEKVKSSKKEEFV